MNVAQHRCLTLLASCKTLKPLNIIHAQVLKTGLDSDLLVAGKLLSHCSVHLSNALDYAFRLLFTTPNPDVFMYNTLIRGYSESESPSNALSIFIHMLRYSNSAPDSFSYAFVLKAVANMRCVRSGFQLHCQAIRRGFQTHLFVGTTLVSVYAECGCVEFAHKSFDEIPEPNIVAWNAVLTAYFRCNDLKGIERTYRLMPFRDLTSLNLMLAGFIKAGELKSAKEYFSEMSITDDVSWSTMIIGFAHDGCFEEAICYFIELLKVGKNPNEVSLTGVLFACAQVGMLDLSKILHGFLEKTGLIWIVSVNNALLDAYSKCGDVDMARMVFDRFPGKRTIVSWGSMLAGLAMQGLGEEALRLFVQMENSGIRPDGITFISVLYACSHAGLVEKGDEIFSRMTQEYGIEPELEHYGCMVDLYGRAGELQKAYNFIIHMPIAPNSIIWRTLLGACSFFGDIELAEQVKKKLTEVDPGNPSDHVLLSNIYAVSGKWKDVATIRRSMREMKMKKTPGWSMVEVDKTMYTFVAGESKSEVNDEAYENLMEIIQNLRVEGGYVPEVGGVFRDIEEEEKENAVSTHSEKLAVAFAIGRSFRGGGRTRRTVIIRIVKNLRVCKDCHTLMKLISKVYQLEIVVRDRSRFHSFKVGSCSCRDYW